MIRLGTMAMLGAALSSAALSFSSAVFSHTAIRKINAANTAKEVARECISYEIETDTDMSRKAYIQYLGIETDIDADNGFSDIAQEIKSDISAYRYRQSLYRDDRNYRGFYGRLHIPAVGIDVAVYRANSGLQAIVNRTDSAAMWSGTPYSACVCGDHRSQGFAYLTGVTRGMSAYIDLADGGRINLVCRGAFNGYNVKTGIPYDIVDGNYASVYGRYNMVCYTCLQDSYHVRIVGFNLA